MGYHNVKYYVTHRYDSYGKTQQINHRFEISNTIFYRSTLTVWASVAAQRKEKNSQSQTLKSIEKIQSKNGETEK